MGTKRNFGGLKAFFSCFSDQVDRLKVWSDFRLRMDDWRKIPLTL